MASAVPVLRSAEDPAALLKSKDANDRLAGLQAVLEAGGDDLPKQLRKMIKDKDWEVVIVAAAGLGEHGEAKDVEALARLAFLGPIRQMREVAASSVLKLDAAEGAKIFGKKLKKETIIPACEALVAMGPGLESHSAPKSLTKLLKSKDLHVRAAAAGALVALEREGRGPLLKDLFGSEFLAVRARALEVAAQQPVPDQVAPIRELLESKDLDDVVWRRALPALAAGIDSMERNPGQTFEEALKSMCSAEHPRVARRGALLAQLALPYTWGQSLDLIALTAAAREHPDAGVRAGAARLLRFVKGDEALKVARERFDQDANPRVRRAAFESVLAIEPVTTEATRTWIVESLSAESSSLIREVLVVALGTKEMAEQGDAVQALIDALQDSDWSVAACAAVSLGLTRSEHAPGPLLKLAQDSEDWRLRGAALVGLCKTLQKPAIDGIIRALADEEPCVRRTAHAYLISINRSQELEPDVETWRVWWADMRDKTRLRDPREQQERNEKYGYKASPEVIYRGLDVLVLESRGDHMQTIFEQLGIEHRLTQSSKVRADALDAGGVFVSNCTGEMEFDDLERLEWFVKVGGYLCGSCWALSETIERIAPGIVTKLNTRDEILDSVLSSACDPDSQYTQGVFGDYVQPIYRLEGAHIIKVLQPERVEMLVDSVECAEKWGGGNLACWFAVGHGTILDSANHFHLQGFENATGLKKPEQRKAFAVDHMGTTLAKIRETQKEKFWTSNHKASEQIVDYSVFRLVTNFVRLRRLEGR